MFLLTKNRVETVLSLHICSGSWGNVICGTFLHSYTFKNDHEMFSFINDHTAISEQMSPHWSG